MRVMAAVILLALTAAAPALAKPRKPEAAAERPAQLQRLIDCRAVADSAQRLACFDRESAAVDQATRSQQLVVIDQGQIRSTKRKLFGFAIPDLGIFGDKEGNEVSAIEGVVAAVGANSDGGVVVTLREGGIWSQIDGKPIALPPVPGDKVMVKRGALGSYLLSVNRQPGVKVRRVG